MANSRKPGHCNKNPFYLSSISPGPLGCNDGGIPDITKGLICNTPGSTGVNDPADPNLRPSLGWVAYGTESLLTSRLRLNIFSETCMAGVSDADEAEFNLLKGKIADQTAIEYVNHRNEFFGSAEEYESFAVESDKELVETKGLRGEIDLGEKPAAQTILYRWIRKAYKNNQVQNVPELIKRGNSDQVRQALAELKKKGVKAGSFNARPRKNPKLRYRLGTISDHGFGDAVDIEPDKNPILSVKEWKFIEQLAGKSIDRSLARWEKEPKALWQDVKDLNALFVEKVASEVMQRHMAQIEKTALETSQPHTEPKAVTKSLVGSKSKSKAHHAQDPINIIFSEHEKLKKYVKGFFTIQWEIAELLHAHGFTWGVTFRSPIDLHHFQLMEKLKELNK